MRTAFAPTPGYSARAVASSVDSQYAHDSGDAGGEGGTGDGGGGPGLR